MEFSVAYFFLLRQVNILEQPNIQKSKALT